MNGSKNRSKDGRRTWRKGTVTAILGTLVLSLFLTPGAEAQLNKGFVVDVGGTAQTSTPYFVGQQWGASSWQLQVTSYNSAYTYFSASQSSLASPGPSAFVSGSAVYFNGRVYVFGPTTQIKPFSTQLSSVAVYVLIPVSNLAWQVDKSFSLNLNYVDSSKMKTGMAAAVANGQIFLFTTGASTQGPKVYSSSDGQNYANVSTQGPQYPVVHDAITFTDPKDGKTRIMVVLSPVDSNYMPLLPAVSIFDPEYGYWGPVSPLPQGALPNSTYGMHASGWLGSWRTTHKSSQGCGTYTWNSGNTDASLHVLGAVWTGSMDYLVHWYLDPSTGTWTFDSSGCAAEKQAMWWAGPCGSNLARTPVALGPGYAKTTSSGCQSGDDCLQQQMYAFSCGFGWQGQYGNQSFNSDLWVPTSSWQGKGTTNPGPWTFNAVDTSNPGDPAFSDDPSVYQAMAGLVRINGVVMGPPPFPADPAWQSPLEWKETSNVQLGQSSGTSSGTASTFDTSMTAGLDVTETAPFVQAKDGLSFTTGYSSTHSTEASFTSTYTWTLGTLDQTASTLGKQGWMIGHAPVISPASYLATSIRDPGPFGTYMGYSQMLLAVSNAQSLFWPFSLTNPSDTSYTMGFLLAGLQPVPVSTDIQGWNVNQGGIMRDWSDTSSKDWKVIAGKSGSGGVTVPVLNMGSQQVQEFVTSHTAGDEWANSYSTDFSTSLRVGTKGNNVKASLDLSAGYETAGSSSTTWENNLETSYLVPAFQGGYSEVYVQPYLLQALTYNAPWVPRGYNGPLPWAITWDVTYAVKSSTPAAGATQTGEDVAAPTPNASVRIVQAMAPPPLSASGRVTGTGAPNFPPNKATSRESLCLPVHALNNVRDDSYSITQGQLSYFDPKGTVTPISMTADDFDVTKGVTVSINGYHLYANIHKGAWSRSWNVWKYTSISGLEKLKLTLDFGAGTWDMKVSQIELGDRFPGLINRAVVTLDLNGLFILATRISHQTAYAWQADLTSFDQPLWVESISVARDLAGKGKVKLNGRLTAAVNRTGDTSVVINGEAKHYALMAKVEAFMNKVTEKGILDYKDDNSSLQADLKSGVWSCEVDSDVFSRPLPFHHGDVQLELKVGGKSFFNASIHPDSYVMALEYTGNIRGGENGSQYRRR